MPNLAPPESLRARVRASVYRACSRHFDGDAAGAEALLSCELPALVETAGADAPAADALAGWIEEDRHDFNRAALISDLVARRLASGSPSVPPRTTTATISVAPIERPRAEPRQTPDIADLLDGMLAQDAARAARSS